MPSSMGTKSKFGGIYPALIPSEKERVYGKLYFVGDLQHFIRLLEYETAVYRSISLEIHPLHGEKISNGQAFCWAGDPDSRELEDGVFDFQHYQKHFKQSLVRSKCPRVVSILNKIYHISYDCPLS
jgi:hypothetical protein